MNIRPLFPSEGRLSAQLGGLCYFLFKVPATLAVCWGSQTGVQGVWAEVVGCEMSSFLRHSSLQAPGTVMQPPLQVGPFCFAQVELGSQQCSPRG